MRGVKRSVFLFVCLLWQWGGIAQAVTLDDLDRILAKAANLGEFLASPALVDEYYEAAREYYGGPERFPKENYLAILAQARTVNERLPEFAARAWETTGVGETHSVTSEAADYAVRLDATAWKEALGAREAKWRADAGALTVADLPKIWSELEATIRSGVKAIDDGGGIRREKDLRRAELFASVRRDERVRPAMALLLAEYFKSAAARRAMDGESADIVLDTFHRLQTNPNLLSEALGLPTPPGFIVSELRGVIPQPKTIVEENAAAFPPRQVKAKDGRMVNAQPGRAATYTFRALPRRFHSFFKGVVSGECVGGGIGFPLADLTPERWATGVMKDSQVHYVEVNGRFNGFVHQVPLDAVAGIGHETVASVDLAAPAFRSQVVVRDGRGETSSVSLFSAWFREAYRRKPATWTGFVVGNTDAIANAGSLASMRLSPEYLLSTETHAHNKFRHHDPMAMKIPGIFPLVGNGVKYGGQMVFEAGAKSVTELKVLQPASGTTADWIRERIAAGDRAAVERWIELVYNGSWDVISQNRIGEMMLSLRDAGLLRLLVDNGFTYRIDSENALLKFLPKLREAGFTWAQMRDARRFALPYVANDAAFLRALAVETRTADDFMELMRTDYVNPDAHYKKMMNELFRDGLDRFIAHSPTRAQMVELLDAHYSLLTTDGWAKAVTYVARASATAADFLDRTGWPLTQREGVTWAKVIAGVYLDTHDHFRSLPTTAAQSREFFARGLNAFRRGGDGRAYLTPAAEKYGEDLTRELRDAPTADAYLAGVEAAMQPFDKFGDWVVARAVMETQATRKLAEEPAKRLWEQMLALRARGNLEVGDWATISHFLVENARTPTQAFEAFDLNWGTAEEYLKIGRELYSRHLDALERFKFTPEQTAKLLDAFRFRAMDQDTFTGLLKSNPRANISRELHRVPGFEVLWEGVLRGAATTRGEVLAWLRDGPLSSETRERFLGIHGPKFESADTTLNELGHLHELALNTGFEHRVGDLGAARATTADDILHFVGRDSQLAKKYFARLRALGLNSRQTSALSRALGGLVYAKGCAFGFKGMVPPLPPPAAL